MLTASSGAQYVYDALNQRVEKTVGSMATEYVYFQGRVLAELNPGSAAWTDMIYAGGAMIAEVAGNQTAVPEYRLLDHLGSLAVQTDNSGNVTGANVFLPFGQLMSSTTNDSFQFTGLEQDTENSSDHAWFRNYSTEQDRWLRPDPYNGSYDLLNPQSFNRYSYVENNPLMFVDPTGLIEWVCDDSGCTAVGDFNGETASDGSGGTLVWNSGTGMWDAPPTGGDPSSSGNSGGFGGGFSGGTVPLVYTGGSSGNGGFGTSASKNPCGTGGIFHGGFGVSYGGTADAGAITAGVTSTGSAGGGMFYDNSTGFSTGGTSSGGVAGYFGPLNAGAPSQQGSPFSVGAYVGGGPSAWITNARSVQQLAGPFTTWSLNVGGGIFRGSLQFSYANGIWDLSVGPPIPVVSFGTPSISLTKLTTNTGTTQGGCQ